MSRTIRRCSDGEGGSYLGSRLFSAAVFLLANRVPVALLQKLGFGLEVFP